MNDIQPLLISDQGRGECLRTLLNDAGAEIMNANVVYLISMVSTDISCTELTIPFEDAIEKASVVHPAVLKYQYRLGWWA